MTDKTKRFAALWDEYAAKCLPPNVGGVQRQETRRAFYAGGSVLFGYLVSMLEPGTEPTAEDVAILEDLNQELHAFLGDVEAGRA